MTDDQKWLARALELAERGRGAVEPNPLVGAVVVRDGHSVGEGWHARFGGPHAEVVALDDAGDRAQGATLYVTLEPCSHHGKTPPCVDRVLSSGVARVVVAMVDPFPAVQGRGIARLREAGVEVDVGQCDSESRRLNAPYLTLLSRQRPYVWGKWAMSLDGKIATRSKHSKWITGESSRRHALAFRGLMDGIVVGVETVIADDPWLVPRPAGARVPTRVILDSRCRTPLNSRLLQSLGDGPAVVVTTERVSATQRSSLVNAGAEVLVLPADEQGRPSVELLLQELGRRRWTNILIEGGAGVLGSFVDAGLVDAVRLYVAGKVIGGVDALSPVGGHGVHLLSEALQFGPLVATSLEEDLFIESRRDST